MFQQMLKRVVSGESLSREEARQAMALMMEGEATASQIAGFITAMKMKGETVEEIVGFATTMREKARSLHIDQQGLVDTCGTGGDGGKTFNISTASAIVAAAGGVRVAKHGNRAVSSKSGSADVLEALGISIQLAGEQAESCLNKTNLCFMFAPLYHQAMKHAAVPRKEVGFPSFFNLLGPLTNPAGAEYQLVGVYDETVQEKVAYVLKELGLKRVLVVHGEDGLDELSISSPTRVVELNQGLIRNYTVTPEQMGLKRYALEDISGGSASDNAEIMKSIFAGDRGAYRDVVCLNSGAVFYLAGKTDTIEEGIVLAQQVIDEGLAEQKLNQLIEVTGEIEYAS